MSDLIRYCAHDHSLTGAEGPVRDLGRWPVLWTCDECGALVSDIPNGPVALPAADPVCPTPAEAMSLATFGRETPISGDASAGFLNYQRTVRRLIGAQLRALRDGGPLW